MTKLPYRLLFPFILQIFFSSAQAAIFTADDDLIGEVTYYRVKENDNFYEIARQFDIGIVELLSANPGVDPELPEVGAELVITTSHILPETRVGVVMNLSELRLFYFAQNGEVMSFPIGIGMDGWQTPTGATSIVRKRKNPAWIPPKSIRGEIPDLPEIIPAGPDNPMGQYALNLAWVNYIIHGTNRPYSVGKRSSHGCIRLYPEDIAVLFGAIEVGTPVTVIDTPYKLGWKGDRLFLEITPTQAQADAIVLHHPRIPQPLPEISDVIEKRAGENTEINWVAVGEAVLEQSGIPVEIGKRHPAPLFQHW